MLIIELVTDAQSKHKADALQQLLDRINKEENITWGQQFVEATLLHPKKGEDGEIEEVSNMDAFLHVASIGWKFLFALCPPPHIWGGWACFIVAIIFIGGLTAVVGQVAGALGCVMGIPPGVTAITFVAIGTSLPDTFASRTAAVESRFADSAVGNVTGSNSVNVFLGLGLPWVIAVIYEN
jgi:solute carrier family 8 (sodium/calcium exchanger)